MAPRDDDPPLRAQRSNLRPLHTPSIGSASRYALLAITRHWLFHRDAFREVSRWVDVGAFEDGGVVGEQLDRNCVEEGGDERVAIRHRNAEGEAVGEASDAGRVG